jgi:hypothetical protein
MRTKLTARRLQAIIEALTARTAGELDIEGDEDTPSREDYDAALNWALEEEDRRKSRNRPTPA